MLTFHIDIFLSVSFWGFVLLFHFMRTLSMSNNFCSLWLNTNQQITELESVVGDTSAFWVINIGWILTQQCWNSLILIFIKTQTSSSFLTLSNSAVSSIFSSRRVGFLLNIFLLLHCLEEANKQKNHRLFELVTYIFVVPNCTLQNETTTMWLF